MVNGKHWEDPGFAFPGPQFWMSMPQISEGRRHFQLPSFWRRLLQERPLSPRMAPLLYDLSILDACLANFTQKAASKLWGSMTPWLEPCGAQVLRPSCAEANMIRFSTYAREMENTIVHLDTFGGEGTWTNFVFNLHLSDEFDDTGTAFWKAHGLPVTARPRTGEAEHENDFQQQVQRMQEMLNAGREQMLAWQQHAEYPGVNVLNDTDPTGRLQLLGYVPFRLNTAVIWRSDLLHSPALTVAAQKRLSADFLRSRTLLQAFLGTHPLRRRNSQEPLSWRLARDAEPPEPSEPSQRRPAHEAAALAAARGRGSPKLMAGLVGLLGLSVFCCLGAVRVVLA
ncbi:unnamed protein product [Effrenium voratum]|nr:unnamed protein product [Effrenium voratum]